MIMIRHCLAWLDLPDALPMRSSMRLLLEDDKDILPPGSHRKYNLPRESKASGGQSSLCFLSFSLRLLLLYL